MIVTNDGSVTTINNNNNTVANDIVSDENAMVVDTIAMTSTSTSSINDGSETPTTTKIDEVVDLTMDDDSFMDIEDEVDVDAILAALMLRRGTSIHTVKSDEIIDLTNIDD